MALETGTFISDLVATNPTGSDALAFADDHIRLVKSTIKATFPNVSGAVSKTHTQINDAVDKANTAVQPAAMDTAIAAAIATAKTALYPVGSIYINATNATNPSTLLGFGTWTAFGAGRVPVGFNASDPLFDTAEETGGSKDAVVVSHTHSFSATTSSAGEHNHTLTQGGYNGSNGFIYNNGAGFTSDGSSTTTSAGAHTHTVSGTTASAGSSGTDANLQPYITVYMWKRTA